MHIFGRVVQNSSFWDGPSKNYISSGAIVYIRAWKAISLPTPDFIHTGTYMKANGLPHGECADFKIHSLVIFIILMSKY